MRVSGPVNCRWMRIVLSIPFKETVLTTGRFLEHPMATELAMKKTEENNKISGVDGVRTDKNKMEVVKNQKAFNLVSLLSSGMHR